MSSCARPKVVSNEQLTFICVPVQGLKCDLKSHVCWHAALLALLETHPLVCDCQLVVSQVYGLLYRQDRDYFEAVKCGGRCC